MFLAFWVANRVKTVRPGMKWLAWRRLLIVLFNTRNTLPTAGDIPQAKTALAAIPPIVGWKVGVFPIAESTAF
jgi:hypothetical protein